MKQKANDRMKGCVGTELGNKFIKLYNNMFDLLDEGIDLLSIVLLSKIISFEENGMSFFVSNDVLAKQFRKDKRTIQRSLEALEVKKLITKHIENTNSQHTKRVITVNYDVLGSICCKENIRNTHDMDVTPPMTPVSPTHDMDVTILDKLEDQNNRLVSSCADAQTNLTKLNELREFLSEFITVDKNTINTVMSYTHDNTNNYDAVFYTLKNSYDKIHASSIDVRRNSDGWVLNTIKSIISRDYQEQVLMAKWRHEVELIDNSPEFESISLPSGEVVDIFNTRVNRVNYVNKCVEIIKNNCPSLSKYQITQFEKTVIPIAKSINCKYMCINTLDYMFKHSTLNVNDFKDQFEYACSMAESEYKSCYAIVDKAKQIYKSKYGVEIV